MKLVAQLQNIKSTRDDFHVVLIYVSDEQSQKKKKSAHFHLK